MFLCLGYVELGFIMVIMGLLGFGKFIVLDILVGDIVVLRNFVVIFEILRLMLLCLL